MEQQVDSSAPEATTAKEMAEQVLIWAKEHHLFSKVSLDEAVDEDEIDKSVSSQADFRSHAVESILRKRSINLVGFNEDQKKVVIFTNGKLSKTDEKVIPFVTAGFVIDYVQGGIPFVKGNPPPPVQPRSFFLHNGKYACGSSIYPAHCVGAGTFGLIVRDASGRMYGMTNNHVAGACNNAMPGLPILAPGPIDATEEACDPFTIGRHNRLLPINDGIPENIDISLNWDVAVFDLTDPDKVSSMQGGMCDTPPTVSDARPGVRVQKVGRTTGMTSGTIIAQSASPLPVAYNVNEYGVKKKVYFEKVFIVLGDAGQPFSRPGDSGSLVIADDGAGGKTAVGLVFAGEEQRGLSFILPLTDIMSKLSLEIVSGHNV